MDNNININDLTTVRKYFSHNIRTSTAMVVATVMVCKYGLNDEMSNMSDIISESAYFLDIYDKGMGIFFDFVLGQQSSKDNVAVEPSKIITHFGTKLPMTIIEQGVTLDIHVNDFKVNANGFIIKSLIEIILCEEVTKGKGQILITNKGSLYTIEKEINSEPPEIYDIFVRLFASLGVSFTYSNNKLQLRF